MRRMPSTLLLAAALVASGSCLAQQAGAVTATPAAADASPAEASATETDAAPAPRSAFGKVIAIMISSLQRQARDGGHPSAPVPTSAAGTPLDIEVGDAFRSTPSPPALPPPPDYAARQPALAGPG